MTAANKQLKPSRVAPAIAALLLIAMIIVGGVNVQAVPGADAYHQSIAQEIEAIPYKIGEYVGVDTEVEPAAVRILKPVKLLRRFYQNPTTGDAFSLLVSSCGNASDMEGHYPPICFPNAGWDTAEPPDRLSFTLTDLVVPATEYTYTRSIDGPTERVAVINLFIIPDDETGLADDMDAVERAASNFRSAKLGATQLQITFDLSVPQDSRRQTAELVLRTIEPTIRVIAEGVTDG